MDDPFDPEDVIGHSSGTGSTVAGLLNSLEPPPELQHQMEKNRRQFSNQLIRTSLRRLRRNKLDKHKAKLQIHVRNLDNAPQCSLH
jgi:hypothetical protein